MTWKCPKCGSALQYIEWEPSWEEEVEFDDEHFECIECGEIIEY